MGRLGQCSKVSWPPVICSIVVRVFNTFLLLWMSSAVPGCWKVVTTADHTKPLLICGPFSSSCISLCLSGVSALTMGSLSRAGFNWWVWNVCLEKWCLGISLSKWTTLTSWLQHPSVHGVSSISIILENGKGRLWKHIKKPPATKVMVD